jgi:WLM domain
MEFNDKGLLGLNRNRGETIKIKLRKTANGVWFSLEEVIGTLLHELMHIEMSRHGKLFDEAVDALKRECEIDMTVNKSWIFNCSKFGISLQISATANSNFALAQDKTTTKKWCGTGIRLGGEKIKYSRKRKLCLEAALKRLETKAEKTQPNQRLESDEIIVLD